MKYTEKEKKALEFLINKRDESYGLMQFEDGELYQLAEKEFNNYLTIEEIIDKQQKEIEALKQENEYLNCVCESDADNFINKDKIREKIKELEIKFSTNDDLFNGIVYKSQINILKELLGE